MCIRVHPPILTNLLRSIAFDCVPLHTCVSLRFIVAWEVGMGQGKVKSMEC